MIKYIFSYFKMFSKYIRIQFSHHKFWSEVNFTNWKFSVLLILKASALFSGFRLDAVLLTWGINLVKQTNIVLIVKKMSNIYHFMPKFSHLRKVEDFSRFVTFGPLVQSVYRLYICFHLYLVHVLLLSTCRGKWWKLAPFLTQWCGKLGTNSRLGDKQGPPWYGVSSTSVWPC